MKTANVYIWSTIDKVGSTVITFAGNIILARLLTPNDFGLVAMVAIFIALAYNISGCGLSDGLIRKLNPSERDYSTVFVFNLAMGVIFCILFIATSRVVANFFGHVELEGIMWAIGISFLCSTVTFTQETRMRKELQMKKLAIVRLSATICAVGLGVFFALNGFGYWSLVSCRIFLSIFLMGFYLIVSRWIPRIAFSRDSFKDLFGYGYHLMLSYIANQFGRNINTFVLGKYSPAVSGVYSQAQKMEEVPFSITEAVFNWAFFPVLSNEPDENNRKKLAQEMYGNLTLINVTMFFLLMLLSYPGFMLLFGEKWLEAVPVFRILIVFGLCSAMKYFLQSILKAYEKTKTIRNLTYVEVALQLGLLALTFKHGVIMIVLSQVCAAIIILFAHLYFYRKIEQITYWELLISSAKPMLLPMMAFVITAIAYKLILVATPVLLNFICTFMAFALIFIVGCEIVKPRGYMVYRSKLLSKIKK